MIIQIQWEFDLGLNDHPDYMQFHNKFADEQGIPLVVDMCDYLKDPESASSDQITDALSDEHGWLINDWYVIEACTTDNTDDIINHQQQPATPSEDIMENINSTTPNSNEVPMSQQEMIVQMFQSFLTDGGAPKVTEFKKHLDALIKSDVKQLCSRSGKSAEGIGWRSELKAKFSGRGAKWVQVPTESVIPTLDRFDTEGFKTETYRTHIENAGFAFIRFAGPRIDSNNNQAAAFEVRVEGSTFDHPKNLHYIAVDQLDNLVESLGGTPHSLNLEAQAKTEDAELVTELDDAMPLDQLEDDLHEDADGFTEIV